MMHLALVLVSLTFACGLRLSYEPQGTVVERWHRALIGLLAPILLVVMSAIALLCMGPSGQMVHHWEGWSLYALSIVFVILSLVWLVQLSQKGWQSLRAVQHHPLATVQAYPCRLLESHLPYSAQVGFWKPELVVSQGLLDLLDEPHLQAVLLHEQAHHHYRDTFWFFWLGWLKAITQWLPQTERLWQELLLLREIRADRWASEYTEPLLLAESLVEVAKAPWLQMSPNAATFSCNVINLRMQERVEALLGQTWQSSRLSVRFWLWLIAATLPLLIIPFHH
ncbi:MAG: M56 family metallopeptidase [Cyanobacteria bacterium P01_D01_bin.44]